MRSAIKVEPATAVVDVVPKERETSRDVWGPAALEQRRERTRNHLAKIAARRESWINRNRYYYELLNRLFRFLVESEKKVLSVRCGTGNPLAVDRPRSGKGFQFCNETAQSEKKQNPP